MCVYVTICVYMCVFISVFSASREDLFQQSLIRRSKFHHFYHFPTNICMIECFLFLCFRKVS